jgi:two-component system nitrogen regulation response regulator NtrX
VVVISGHATVHDAVHAIKLGASDFFEKPLNRERVLVSVAQRCARAPAARARWTSSNASSSARYEMIGQSAAMQRLFNEIDRRSRRRRQACSSRARAAPARSSSPRHPPPLAPRKPLREGQLRRHPARAHRERALRPREGRLHGRAQPQARLLRAGPRGHPVPRRDRRHGPRGAGQGAARAPVRRGRAGRQRADHARGRARPRRHQQGPGRAVQNGRFREDLFFRLNVFPIRSPSLRERPRTSRPSRSSSSTPFCRENGLRPKTLDRSAILALERREWPGNVRELKNAVERAAILSSGDVVTIADLPEDPHQSPFDDDTAERGAGRRRRSAGARADARAPPPCRPRRTRALASRCASSATGPSAATSSRSSGASTGTSPARP